MATWTMPSYLSGLYFLTLPIFSPQSSHHPLLVHVKEIFSCFVIPVFVETRVVNDTVQALNVFVKEMEK
jgi:hypothetical protein